MILERRICNFILKRVRFDRSLQISNDFKFIPRTMSLSQSKNVIAISQMCSTNDKEANMRQVTTLINKAKSGSASFLFLPECCDFVGENSQQTLDLSEPLTGSTMQQYKELAKQNCIWLSLGGIHESLLDNTDRKVEKIFNSHVIINDKGEIVTVYRKMHLFDVSTPEFRFCESKVVAPGPCLIPPLATPIGILGLQICYDVRFAESSLLLAKMGAQLLTYPSAFAYTTGKAHWEILLRARAIENQCFVVAPAQLGYHNSKRRSWGHAMVVNPLGTILADCGGEDELSVATVEIDLAAIKTVKQNMPCFEHRRHDIYSLTAYDVGSYCAQEDRLFANNTIRKETIFYESEYCYAFTNLCCVVDGHVLVSTKRIIPRLNGLNCAEMADLFTTVCRIQRMLEDIYQTTAATVTVQDGEDAGQTVPHVHFHVMPRRQGDFGENDQIYVKLEDRVENKSKRCIEDRMKEAEKYRIYLKQNLDQQHCNKEYKSCLYAKLNV